MNNKTLCFTLDADSLIGAELLIAPRVLETWQMLVACRSNKEIARLQAVALATVKNRLAELYALIGARNRTHAAMLGVFMMGRYPALNRPIAELLAQPTQPNP